MSILDMEQWNELSAKILESKEQADISELLVQATDSYSEMFATHAKAVEENKRLEDSNEKLRKVNMKYMLRIGDDVASGSPHFERQKSRAETITFEDLFKEEK